MQISSRDNGYHHANGGHHHGGGALIQNVIQALQSLGVSFPGSNAGPSTGTSPDGNSSDGQNKSATSTSSVFPGNVGRALDAFLHDLRQALKQGGDQAQASTVTGDGQSPAPTPPTSEPTDSAPATPTASTDIGQALHTFLHGLRQALQQSAQYQQASATDGDSDKSRSKSVAARNYKNFNANLQNLINTLGNDAGNGGDKYAQLRTDFANLVTTLGGATSSQAPTLLDFLKKLANNAGISGSQPNNTGTIVTAEA
jgi:hypothetical protein